MHPRSRVVVFDLGNVLIRWDRRLLFSKLIEDSDELEYFLDHVYTLDANQALDSGTPLPEVVSELAKRHPEHRDVIEALGDRWIETIGGAIPESVELLRELADRWTPLYALSNWGADTFAMIEADYPFLKLFDGVVISGREGVTKPDPEIFARLCRRNGFAPGDALFIDDSATNVEAAAALGFDALLFDNPAQLREELAARDLV